MRRGTWGSGALALALSMGAAAAGAQDRLLAGATVEMVSVDVSVIRDGRAVPGLAADRFEVRDEGTRREAELVASGDLPLHVLLLMDVSESVEGERVQGLVRAAQSLFPDLRPGDRVGLVTFSEQVRLLAGLDSSPPAVKAMLGRVQPGGGTSLRDAAWSALKLTGQVRGRILVVLFTDGSDTSSWLSEDAVLAMARESDAVLHVLYTAAPSAASSTAARGERMAERDFLTRLSEVTGGRLWDAGRDDDLGLNLRRALAEMRSRYVLRFERPPDARPGWHRLEVRLKGVKGDLLARRGYFVPVTP
jgi:VWFA-related protein